MNGPSPKLSVVLPCLNEASHLEASLQTICEHLSALDRDYELLAIDDGSSDDTWQVICRSAMRIKQLRGLRLSRRFGKELALCAGLERARGQAVVVMDADLQHPPTLLAEMVRLWEQEGYDVVEAVKADRSQESLATRVEARFFSSLLRRLTGIDLRGASDFKLLDRKVLDAWTGMPEHNVFFRGMSAWLGFRRKTVPFTVASRAGGKTSWSFTGLIRLALTGITSFSSLPVHLVTLMGFVFFLFSVALGLLTLTNYLAGEAVPGFTTVIILQLMIASLIMTSLGILGTYVARIYEEVKNRPRYVLSETTEPSDLEAPAGNPSE